MDLIKLKIFCSKGNHKNDKKTTHRMGENICKWCYWQGIKIQNIKTAHSAQNQKNNPNKKIVE